MEGKRNLKIVSHKLNDGFKLFIYTEGSLNNNTVYLKDHMNREQGRFRSIFKNCYHIFVIVWNGIKMRCSNTVFYVYSRKLLRNWWLFSSTEQWALFYIRSVNIMDFIVYLLYRCLSTVVPIFISTRHKSAYLISIFSSTIYLSIIYLSSLPATCIHLEIWF